MELYTANETEWEKVRDFYWQLIDSMDSALSQPESKKGIYPSDELLMRSRRGKELYVLLSGSTYAAAIILNHKSTEGYEKIQWSISANPREVTVVHALGVLPRFWDRASRNSWYGKPFGLPGKTAKKQSA